MAPGAVQYFAPAHLPGAENQFRNKLRPLAVTYLAYSANGAELIVNVGGEHVYYYDKFSLYGGLNRPCMLDTLAVIENCDKPALDKVAAFYAPQNGVSAKSYPPATKNGGNGTTLPPLPLSVEELKLAANSEFEQKNYNKAVELYNKGIYLHPHPILFGNRAAALMKRNYSGDMYAAARDCVSALAIDPGHVKGMLRLARCLHELDWFNEAEYCLNIFKAKYPEHTKSPVYAQLLKDIAAAADKRQSTEEMAESKPTPRRRRRMYTRQDFLRGSEPPAEDGTGEDSDDDMEVVEGPGGGEEGPAGGEDSIDVMDESGLPFSPASTKRGVLSDQEVVWRSKARDYTSRFIGACNITTDIKVQGDQLNMEVFFLVPCKKLLVQCTLGCGIFFDVRAHTS